MILLIIKGYPGSGKTTLAGKFAKKHDFALIKQDSFWFGLNPGSMISRFTRSLDRQVGFKNIISCTENYMEVQKPILIEGALLVDVPGEPPIIPAVLSLAAKYKYDPIIITLKADDKTRHKRQRKRGYILRPHIDNRLKRAAQKQFADLDQAITLDTSCLSIKKSIEALEDIILKEA